MALEDKSTRCRDSVVLVGVYDRLLESFPENMQVNSHKHHILLRLRLDAPSSASLETELCEIKAGFRAMWHKQSQCNCHFTLRPKVKQQHATRSSAITRSDRNNRGAGPCLSSDSQETHDASDRGGRHWSRRCGLNMDG